MKIVFLNVWNFTNKDFAEAFISEHVQTTDVFCFQEAYEKTKWLLKDILKDFSVYADYKFISDKDDFPLATYIKQGIDIVSNRTLLMDIPLAGLALYTHLRSEGRNIHLCNVHGVSKPGNKLDDETRLAQSTSLIDSLNSLEGIKILGGDFNLEATTKSVKMFEEAGYKNLIKDYSINTTRNKYVWDRFPESKQYFSDYVFIDASTAVRGFVVPDSEASDHLPLILTI